MSDATWTLSVKGQVQRVGSYSAADRDNLLDLIYREAGGMATGRFQLKAVLWGGPLGHFLDDDALKRPVSTSGEIMVVDEGSCIVNVVRLLSAYNLFCQQGYTGCAACRQRLSEAVEIMGRLCSGSGKDTDLARLQQLAAADGKNCRDNCSALNPLRSALALFAQEFADHAAGRCPASICGELMLSPCSNSCPAGVDLPGTIALMQLGKFHDALALGRHDNPLFLSCGFVCEEPPCQKNCKRLAFDDAVYSQSMHRYAGEKAADKAGSLEKALAHPAIHSGTATGKKVAVIGAGPAGLSAGYFLTRLGHKAVLYEKAHAAGGMVAFGIPAYRADRRVLAAEVAAIQSLGVEIVTNCTIGRDITIETLSHEYDAILIAIGAGSSRKLGLPGEDLPGVRGAVEFLAEAAGGNAVPIGQKVLIVGGGNVAADAARTARRLGAQQVEMMCVEDIFEMPATRHEIAACQQEGVVITPLSVPVAFVGNGYVEKVVYTSIKPGPYDKLGRRWPPQAEERRQEKNFDSVIIAIGQMPDTAALAVNLAKRGPFLSADNYRVGTGKIYAAGDCAGPVNTVVKAVQTGKEAAFVIDRELTGSVRSLGTELRKGLGCFTGSFVCHSTPRIGMPEQDVRIRLNNFDLVELGLKDEQANYEMLRCVCAAKGSL